MTNNFYLYIHHSKIFKFLSIYIFFIRLFYDKILNILATTVYYIHFIYFSFPKFFGNIYIFLFSNLTFVLLTCQIFWLKLFFFPFLIYQILIKPFINEQSLNSCLIFIILMTTASQLMPDSV